MDRIWQALAPMVEPYWPVIAGVWLYMLVGALLAGWTVWDVRRRHLRGRLGWGLAVQFIPPVFAVYLLTRHDVRPFSTPFGETRGVSAAGKLLPQTRDRAALPTSKLFLLRFLAGALVPGVGQIAFGRPFRALFIWCLIAFAGTLALAHTMDERRTWAVPDRLLLEAQRGSDVTVNFRVPRYLFIAMCAEMVVVLLATYGDTVRLGDEKATERARHPDSGAHAYYHLSVARPDGQTEQHLGTDASVAVGSSEHCDVVLSDDGVLPEHVVFYLHHVNDDLGEIRFRCVQEDAQVRHNADDAHAGALAPGDVVQVGASLFTFQHLP